jgi:hypothetical protein
MEMRNIRIRGPGSEVVLGKIQLPKKEVDNAQHVINLMIFLVAGISSLTRLIRDGKPLKRSKRKSIKDSRRTLI